MTEKIRKVNQDAVLRMKSLFPDSPLRRILILGPSGSGKSTLVHGKIKSK